MVFEIKDKDARESKEHRAKDYESQSTDILVVRSDLDDLKNMKENYIQ
jgi:hypothetical protein